MMSDMSLALIFVTSFLPLSLSPSPSLHLCLHRTKFNVCLTHCLQTDAMQENIRLYICMKFSEKKLVTDVSMN